MDIARFKPVESEAFLRTPPTQWQAKVPRLMEFAVAGFHSRGTRNPAIAEQRPKRSFQ